MDPPNGAAEGPKEVIKDDLKFQPPSGPHPHQRGRGRGRGFMNRGGGGGGGFRRGGFRPHFNRNEQNRGGFRQDDGPMDEDSREQHRFPYIDKIGEKLATMGGPTLDLPIEDSGEKKFSGRSRLYIGNMNPEATEDDITELFSKYGETCELFINKEKNFAFVKFDYYSNAEKAKRECDGVMFKGKNLKIRFAPSNATVKVKNLSNFVSNELLTYAFQIFGEVERAMVQVDERGKPTGEGIVEFSRKGCALHAIRKCSERCFFLTDSLRPCIVEHYEYVNDTDGYPEKFLPKRHPEFLKIRGRGPRFAELNSFEHEYGKRWKQLLELYNEKEDALKKELQMEKDKLEAQMEYARYEHETEMLREQLRMREQDRDRQKQEWEMKERLVEEQRRRNEEDIRRREENLQTRMSNQDDELRRRQQENNLFMQAHQLHNILDEQEQAFGGEPDMEGENSEEFKGPRPNKGRWVNDRRDDFVPKRRRF